MSSRRRAAAAAALCALVAAPAAGAATRAPAPSPTAGAAAACPNADQTSGNATVADLTTGVRCVLNQERTGAGRRAVVENRELASAASRHAADMVSRHYFAHTSLGGSTFVDRIRRTGYLPARGRWSAGEILAWTSGSLATPRGLVDAWMASPEHRRILLDPSFSEVGVGVVVGAPRAGVGDAITATADFGRVR
jgi:uncharacterized protein YkwD